MTAKGISSLLILIAFIGCKKCEDCSTTRFSKFEKQILLVGQNDQLSYTDGEDTFSIKKVENVDQAGETCAGFLGNPTCMSEAWTHLRISEPTISKELVYARIYKIQKKHKYKATYDITVGPLTFYIRADTLYPADGRGYTFSKLNDYIFNQHTYQNVQEIRDGADKVLYHPDLGFFEITYASEGKTYTRVP